MEKNLKILILIGIPASGKSTWSNDFIRKNPNYVRVNRDYFRLMLRNEQMCETKIEGMISDLVTQTIHTALSKKLNVIVDNTNLKVKYIYAIIDEFKHRADIDYQVFDISLNKAIERDKNRQQSVGEEVIKRMYNDYKILMDSFHFQPVKKIQFKPFLETKRDENLPDCVIFDIDGTLALMNDKRGPFDWKKVYKDEINDKVAEMVDFHKEKGRIIIIVSGRDAICEKETKEWLELHGTYYDHLYMRPINDMRKDTIVKEEIYYNFIQNKYNVHAVYDDRLQVLKMWYNKGIFTFNINQGNIIF